MTITALSSRSEETAPRKNAENTVKHHDGGVGSVVANHRGGGKKFGDHNNTKCNHQLDGCIVWNAHNTIFSSRHACRHVTKNSTAWQPTTARLLAMVINNSTAFTLQSYSEASNIGKNATHVGRRRKFGDLSCTKCTGQANDSELIPTVKMETRHPVEESFSRKTLQTKDTLTPKQFGTDAKLSVLRRTLRHQCRTVQTLWTQNTLAPKHFVLRLKHFGPRLRTFWQ